jgi:hypothetical protein
VTTVLVNICISCRHLDTTTEARRCTAFPDGIPKPIYIGGFDHRNPYPGDHGIRHETLEGMEDMVAEYELRRRTS